MNEMDKAKLILAGELKGTFIAEKTGINKQNISNYRTNRTDIKLAKWEVIHALAELYDMTIIAQKIGDDQLPFTQFIGNLTNFFKELIDDQKELSKSDEGYPDDLKTAKILDYLNDYIVKDPVLLTELFEIYKK